jgi:hypothetical protein
MRPSPTIYIHTRTYPKTYASNLRPSNLKLLVTKAEENGYTSLHVKDIKDLCNIN